MTENQLMEAVSVIAALKFVERVAAPSAHLPRRLVAFHEAGHAAAGVALGCAFPALASVAPETYVGQ